MEAEALSITAVIVGAIAAFAFGSILYHPKVFGTIWAEGSGVTFDGAPPILAFVAQIAALIFLALVIGITATISFLWTAIFAILAAACFVVSGGAFTRKSTGALAVDGGYIVGSGVLMIIAQGIF